MKAIEQHERTKRRHLIKPEKRALIESRRPLAKGTTHMHTGIHFDETSHDKHLKRCYQKNGIGSHRDAFYRPEHILDKLRQRIKTSAIIGTCVSNLWTTGRVVILRMIKYCLLVNLTSHFLLFFFFSSFLLLLQTKRYL